MIIKTKDPNNKEEAEKKLQQLILQDLLQRNVIDEQLFAQASDIVRNGKPKHLIPFEELSEEEKQKSLMFSAMRVREIFEDLHSAGKLNLNKLCDTDSIEKFSIFANWVLEFEKSFHGTDEYYEDYIGFTERCFSEDIALKWGTSDFIEEFI